MNPKQARGQSPLATKPLTKKKESIKIIRCSNCNVRFDPDQVTFANRKVEDEDGLKEIGLECPNCGEWYHSYFLDKDLENPKLPNRRARRAYRVKFDKFQKRTRAKMGLRRVDGRWVKDAQVEKGEADNE